MPNSFALRRRVSIWVRLVGSAIGWSMASVGVLWSSVAIVRSGRRTGTTGDAQPVEGLRAGDLVHEVEVDVDEVGRAVLALLDQVGVPDLLGQGARSCFRRAHAVRGCCVHAFASSESAASRRRTPRRDRPRTRPRRGTEEEVVEHAPLQATPCSTALDPVARRTRRAAASTRSGRRRRRPGSSSRASPSGVSTRVPFVECRSVTTTRPSTTSTSACVFDTERAGSSSAIAARLRAAADRRPDRGRAPRDAGASTSSPPGDAEPPGPGLRGCGRRLDALLGRR